jgi:hypothetical protein
MDHTGNNALGKNVLLEIILRRILQEGAVQPDVAAQQGIALHTFGSGALTTYVLYNTRSGLFEELLNYSQYMRLGEKSGGEIYLPAVKRSIVGTMQVYPGGRGQPATINGVKAEKGYGPLLHDIAMVFNRELEQDDVNSPAELRLWDYYRDKRRDVIYHQSSDPSARPRISLKNKDALFAQVRQLKQVHEMLERRVELHKQQELQKSGRGAVVINWDAFVVALETAAVDAIMTLHM